MTLDGLTLYRIVTELKEIIIGSKIEKIYQPEREEIVLLLHTSQGKKRLNLSANGGECRLGITCSAKENPGTAPNFCMLLRKYLSSGKITDISQMGLERIAEIKIDARDEMGFIKSYSLICEIMGKYSNIILALDGKVIDSIKRVPPDLSSVRQILPGITYEAPPLLKLNPLVAEETQIAKSIAADGLLSLEGISFQTAAELEERFFNGSSDPASMLIYAKNIKSFLTQAVQSPMPVMQKNMEGLPVFFSLVPYNTFSQTGRVYFDTANELLDGYYTERFNYISLKHKKDALLRIIQKNIKRVEKKLKIQLETLKEADNSEKLRLYGELLSANIYLLKRGMKNICVLNYYTGENVIIPLDEKLSPSANVQAYFKKVGKLKNAKEIAEERSAKYKDELYYLETLKYMTDTAKNAEDAEEVRSELIRCGYIEQGKKEKLPKRNDPLSSLMRFKVSDGFTVLAGKNSRQNDALTLHAAGDEDIWFHAKNIPGSHVVLFLEGREPTDAAIEDAAKIAASLCSAKSGRVEVDYVKRKNIWKANGAKPGMVLFKNQYSMIAEGGEEVLKRFYIEEEK